MKNLQKTELLIDKSNMQLPINKINIVIAWFVQRKEIFYLTMLSTQF